MVGLSLFFINFRFLFGSEKPAGILDHPNQYFD